MNLVTVPTMSGSKEQFLPGQIRKIMPVGNEAGVIVGLRIILGYQTWIDTPLSPAQLAYALTAEPTPLEEQLRVSLEMTEEALRAANTRGEHLEAALLEVSTSKRVSHMQAIAKGALKPEPASGA